MSHTHTNVAHLSLTRITIYDRRRWDIHPTLVLYRRLISYNVLKWKHCPRYRSFVTGIHRSPVVSPTKASDAELWCFLWSVPEQTVEQTIETPLIWDSIALIMTSLLFLGYILSRRMCVKSHRQISYYCHVFGLGDVKRAVCPYVLSYLFASDHIKRMCVLDQLHQTL